MSRKRNLYILCGGKSRRMGRDKALIDLKGESLLEIQISKAKNYFNKVILLSGSNSYPVDLKHLPDAAENAGPLSGLLAALRDGAEHGMDQVAIISVDLPKLSETSFEKLSACQPVKSADAVLLQANGNIQPLAGIYKTELAAKLEHYLQTGNRMVFGFADSLHYSTISVVAVELYNLNRPDDLDCL